MPSVCEFLDNPEIDRILDQLDDEKTFGLALLAFSRTVVDQPDNFEKISNSFSGHVANLQIHCVLREIRLWCCRVWEKNGHSLPVLKRSLSGKEREIQKARQLAHPDFSQEFLELRRLPSILHDWGRAVEARACGSTVRNLRITRDEHFAHLLQGRSGARKKMLSKASIEEGYSFNEVLDLVEESCRLISEAIRIWRFHVHSDEDFYNNFQSYCKSYWEFFPNLSEAERERRLGKMARK